jgi:DNA-binding NtrC family response regulator
MRQILMVDDDPTQLRIRGIILRGAGFLVNVATDVDSALACLRSPDSEVGVVITDHNLRGRSGADLVRELRLFAPALPVVVLSGMPGIEPDYDGLDVTFRFKPLPPGEFIEVIQRFLSQ